MNENKEKANWMACRNAECEGFDFLVDCRKIQRKGECFKVNNTTVLFRGKIYGTIKK